MDQREQELIGQSLFGFQAALKQYGMSLMDYIESHYLNHWLGETMHAALEVRTAFVAALHEFFTAEGLLNIDRVQMCIITDPLAHDVEHAPTIAYKGQTYFTTHSMIYSKFLACHSPRIKGIFIDSPNIRLELESPDRVQRGKYLIDFSQFDIEVRRNRGLTLEDYMKRIDTVKLALSQDLEKAKDMFERMMVHCITRINERNAGALKHLGVNIPIPSRPFPAFRYDLALEKYGKQGFERALGQKTDATVFWVTGIPRENYDLIYPYLLDGGAKVRPGEINSTMVYNYDLYARGVDAETGAVGMPLEILSGAVREWLFEPIVERLMDNRVIPQRPEINGGNVENINMLGGYGPFLLVAARKAADGGRSFPETFGGGIGIERALYAMCRGQAVKTIENVTCFGKNPDSQHIYLF
jgi:aspartyl/asparaginyl-tRNA synthetase